MKNKIVLVYPKIDYEENYKYSWTPFSLLSLAGVLLENDFIPIIFDQNIDTVSDWISEIETQMNEVLCIGFSIMTGGGQIKHALTLAKTIKSEYPEIPLIWGGPHVSVMPHQTANHSLVDIAVVGQGEKTLVDIARALARGVKTNEIKGVVVGERTNSEHQPVLHNKLIRKNAMPNYPWHLLQMESYIRNDVTINNRTLGYISSQGCPYRCSFCYEFGTYNGWWSGFKAPKIISDIVHLVDDYAINGVKFYDADFFVNPRRVSEFCDGLIEKKLGIFWAGSANPHDILRLENRFSNLLEKIKSTNCTRILMGLESGSDKILKFINKDITVEDLKKVVIKLTNYEFIGSFTFIVGFPGETKDDLQQTFKLIDYIHSKSDLHETRLHIFAPYPGTPLFNVAIDYGFIAPKKLEEWSDYNYYQPQTPWVDAQMVDVLKNYTKMH